MKRRIYFKDKDFEADYKLMQKRLPGKGTGVRILTKDERLWIISRSSDMEPGGNLSIRSQFEETESAVQSREKLRAKRSHDETCAATSRRTASTFLLI